MTDHHAPEIAAQDDAASSGHTMSERSEDHAASQDGDGTITDHVGHDAGPLLGLTSPNTDTVDLDGKNIVPIEDSNFDTRRDPLLGTIFFSTF